MPLEDIRESRLSKLKKLRKLGLDPYPADAHRTHTVGEALEQFKELAKGSVLITLAGRIRSRREHGGSIFSDLEDESSKIQIYVKQDAVSNEQFAAFSDLFDIGDFAEISGTLFETKTGEKTLLAKNFRMLVKSLRPLPEKWHGLEDVEERLRRRYLDLLMRKDVCELFRLKSQFWANIRSYMQKAGFLEVETPVLEAVPGGADAEPFVTHLNALDIDLYLRISLELPLKRLLVGGYEKVFEIGRIFRNEGIDATHLQDYTQMEFYWAYQNLDGLMRFVRELYQNVIKEIFGTLTTNYKGNLIDWAGEWPRLDYCELFEKELGLNLETASREELFKKAQELGFAPEKWLGKGRLIDHLFKKQILPKVIQPAFLVDHPVAISPLAKQSAENPEVTKRMQVVACGLELGNGWSELNDPMSQRARFEEQMKLRAEGDKEAQMLDEDFIEALEYGMPPAAGFGMSERLFAVLMDKSIRECVFFPLMRPK